MKRAFAICLALLSIGNLAMGMPAIPLKYILRGGQNIYLVKVTSNDDRKVDFSITQVLRGESQQLTHLIAELNFDYKIGSEYILISTGDLSNGNNIDTGFYGNFAWYPMAVTRDGDKVKIQGIGDLDQFSELLKKNPYKR
jgi:hypothetical protein